VSAGSAVELPADGPAIAAPAAPRPAISLVFPVFDEENNIGPLLESSLRLAPRIAQSFEIVVVDDGSRDGSARVIERHQRVDPRIRVVRHRRNRGYGAALRTGLCEARGDLVFFTDSDLQFDIAELSKLLSHTDRFDIVAGYRHPRRDPWPRRAIAWVWGTLVRSLFGLRVRDIDCAFKVFHRRVIEAIPTASIGAFVNTELLVRALREGFRIHQVPVTHRRRRFGRQTGARPRVIFRAVIELATLYSELRRPGCNPGRRVRG
jgi:glycosyltransferase involved in cell wall biosynthesis